jgi:hypothetical protein
MNALRILVRVGGAFCWLLCATPAGYAAAAAEADRPAQDKEAASVIVVAQDLIDSLVAKEGAPKWGAIFVVPDANVEIKANALRAPSGLRIEVGKENAEEKDGRVMDKKSGRAAAIVTVKVTERGQREVVVVGSTHYGNLGGTVWKYFLESGPGGIRVVKKEMIAVS